MGIALFLRRFAYKAEQVGAESRNAEREALIQQEIRRGQRCGWVLGYHIQHPAGNKPGALLQTASHTMPIVQFSTPRGSKVAVRYAALTGFQVDTEAEIIATTSTLAARVQDITATLPTDIPCCLMLDCDDDIRQCVESHLKMNLLPKQGEVSGSCLAKVCRRLIPAGPALGKPGHSCRCDILGTSVPQSG